MRCWIIFEKINGTLVWKITTPDWAEVGRFLRPKMGRRFVVQEEWDEVTEAAAKDRASPGTLQEQAKPQR